MKRLLFNFLLAVEGVTSNMLRSILTALGILFGVGAVIAMLAIGRGAKQQIIDQMKLIGTNSILVEAEVPQNEDQEEGGGKAKKPPYTPGLTLKDVKNIQSSIPSVEKLSVEIVLKTSAIYNGKLNKLKCIGTTNDFFDVNNMDMVVGSTFHQNHAFEGKPVCIIGKNVQTKMFNGANPVGKLIKCGNVWLRVIGVVEKHFENKINLEDLGIRDFNDDVYIPINTALVRFKNRAKVTKKVFANFNDDENNGNVFSNYHQIDRMVVQVAEAEQLRATANIIGRMLKRRHNGVEDYEIDVPLEKLEQQQKTQNTFNIVLAAIAGISLLVGGIGIMNIMLASVLERIKEIGVRRSLGAHQLDIVQQFLLEATIISLIGGVLGVVLGMAAADLIASSADIPTIVTSGSVALAFGVAALVGLVFGYVPAQRAAKLDPIKALRYE